MTWKAELRMRRVESRRDMTFSDNSRMGRIRQLLDLVLREAHLSYSDVEERLKWGAGTASRLLKGKRELRLEQLLAILDLAGMPASRFFAISERFASLEEALDIRAAILQAFSGKDAPLGLATDGIRDDELQTRIEEALRKVLKEPG
jgi:transcriptional regulator with XRE-family HTH domain